MTDRTDHSQVFDEDREEARQAAEWELADMFVKAVLRGNMSAEADFAPTCLDVPLWLTSGRRLPRKQTVGEIMYDSLEYDKGLRDEAMSALLGGGMLLLARMAAVWAEHNV